RIPEGDEVLAQELHALGRAVVVRQLGAHQGRDPVLPHEVTHDGAGTNATKQLVLFSAQHDEALRRRCVVYEGILVQRASVWMRAVRSKSTNRQNGKSAKRPISGQLDSPFGSFD